jgi:hypothetical protein
LAELYRPESAALPDDEVFGESIELCHHEPRADCMADRWKCIPISGNIFTNLGGLASSRPAVRSMQQSPRIVLFLEATRGFDRGLLEGVARYSTLNGPWTFYRQPHGYLRSKRRLDMNEIEAWKPDGAICPGSRTGRSAR